MRTLVALVVLGALLGGCASQPPMRNPVHPHRIWVLHAAKMRAITRFALSAEGGVRAGAHGGTLMLRWVLMPQAYQMTGYGPFGRLIFRLRVNAAGARLRTERGRFRGPNAGALLARLTGWRLPVAGLRFWILGVPAPGPFVHRHVNRWGLLGSLDQAGWSIRYHKYHATQWGRLPRLLTLTHGLGVKRSPEIIVTIRIDQWQTA
ncbi:MAG: lipoprotein insertase outer membrane protein LolB [Acidiferrobacter sp.]